MTFINFKILIYIFILLSSCSSHISNEFSDNSTSTQIKSNEFQLNKNKIKKKKLENLYVVSNPGESVVFEFRKERYLEGIQNKEVENKIDYAQKALQATFKMLSKAPTTGMEHLKIKNTSHEINYNFENFYNSTSVSDKINEEQSIERNFLNFFSSTLSLLRNKCLNKYLKKSK